jgi:hypothetical protein
LSYYFVPLVFHNETQGRLFVRSSWDESATWFGYFDGHLQLFQDGKVTELSPMLMSQPLFLSEAVVLFARNTQKFRLLLKEEEEVFVLGLKPGAVYQVEVDDEEMTEVAADRGGILELKLPRKIEVGVRFKEAGHS